MVIPLESGIYNIGIRAGALTGGLVLGNIGLHTMGFIWEGVVFSALLVLLVYLRPKK